MECQNCKYNNNIEKLMMEKRYERSWKKIPSTDKSWFKRNKFEIFEWLIIVALIIVITSVDNKILDYAFMGFGITGIASISSKFLKCFYD